MEIQTSEQLAFYVDTLKMLFATAHREHNTAVQEFLHRFLDGLVPRAALLPLVQDDTTRKLPATTAERDLERVATALASPIEPLPPSNSNGSGGALVPKPEPDKPLNPPSIRLRESDNLKW